MLDRADGCCELCGTRLHDGSSWLAEQHSIHHRRPRGMGGTSDATSNGPANLLLLCGSGVHGCHGLVESQRVMAASEGWLVAHGHNPADVPVGLYVTPPLHRTWLTDDGAITVADGTDTWRLR